MMRKGKLTEWFKDKIRKWSGLQDLEDRWDLNLTGIAGDIKTLNSRME
jgi:hypothetical protein